MSIVEMIVFFVSAEFVYAPHCLAEHYKHLPLIVIAVEHPPTIPMINTTARIVTNNEYLRFINLLLRGMISPVGP